MLKVNKESGVEIRSGLLEFWGNEVAIKMGHMQLSLEEKRGWNHLYFFKGGAMLNGEVVNSEAFLPDLTL